MRRTIVLLSTAVCVLGLVPQTARASTRPVTTAAQSAAATAASKAPGHIGRLEVSARTSTSATLTWANPRSANFAGTEVRLIRGTVPPKTPTSGHHVTRVSRTHRSITLTHLAPGTGYAAALFATDGHGHYSARRAVGFVTPPGPVTSLRSYDVGTDAQLTWTLPRTASLARIVVRYAYGSVAPTKATAGHGTRLNKAKASSVRLTGLAKDSRYAVAVFALDRAGRVSTPAVTRFLTLADPARNGAVTGRVTDSGSDPLVGVDVTATDYQLSGASMHTVTGADGRYSIPLAAGLWFFAFGGQNIRGGSSDAAGYLATTDGVSAIAGRTVDLGTETLAPGAAVSGRVVTADGTPVGSAPMHVSSVYPYVSSTSGSGGTYFSTAQDGAPLTRTAANGTYVVRGVPAGAAVRVCAGYGDDAGTSVCSHTSSLTVAGADTAAGDLVRAARAGGSISGVLRGGSHGLGGADVDAQPLDDASTYADVSTARSGSFALTDLVPGRYAVCAQSYRGGLTGYAAGCVTVTVRAGRTATVELRLTKGAAVSGVVTGPGGHPLAGAYVGVERAVDTEDGISSSGYATTDSRGHYRVVGLDAAPERVCVQAGGSSRHLPTGALGRCTGAVTVRTRATRADVNVALRVAAAVGGRVLDEHGHPVPDALVSVTARNAGPGIDTAPGTDGIGITDNTGTFLVTGLGAYSFRVCFVEIVSDTDGFIGSSDADCTGSTVITRRGTRVDTVLHTTSPSGATVTVRDQAGAAVAGVDVTAVTACAHPEIEDCETVVPFGASTDIAVVGSQVTEADGVATLEGLLPGRYAICLFAYYGTTASGGSPTGYADRCSGSTFDLVVKSGSHTPVGLVLAPGGAVSGRVTDRSGHPLAGVHVRVASAASTDYPGAEYRSESGLPSEYDAPGADLVSGPDGRYTVGGVVPGHRTVCVEAGGAHGGSSAGGYLDQCLGGTAGSSSGGNPVTVTASTVATVPDLALTAGSSLAGRVTAAGGEPLEETEVTVFAGRNADKDPAGFADTGSSGTWRIRALPAGHYTVCFDTFSFGDDSGSGPRYLGQCWKGVNFDDEASNPPLARVTLVSTTAGSATTGIDGALVKRH